MKLIISAFTAFIILTAVDALGAEAPPATYGTGVFFDEGSRLAPGDFSVIRDGISLSDERTGNSVLRAESAPGVFGLGVYLDDPAFGRTGGAQAASSYEVEGAPEGDVITGLYFSIDGRASSSASGGFSVYFAAYDYMGNFLADVSFVGERHVDGVTGEVFVKDTFAANYCPDPVLYPRNCSDPDDPVKSKAVYLSGEGTKVELPVILPAIPGNGVIAELWGFTDNMVKLDFLSTTLKGAPPEGVIIRLSTGQTFGSGVKLCEGARAC